MSRFILAYLLLILFTITAPFQLHAAVYTQSDQKVKVTAATPAEINAWGICWRVAALGSYEVMVPFKTANEWTHFIANVPTNMVTISPCLPPACTADGTACAAGSDCCSGICTGSICMPPPCKIPGETCAVAGDCCSNICTGSICMPPPCKTPGETCAVGSDCCSNICTGSICMPPPPVCKAVGETCTVSADCCSPATCAGGVCTLACVPACPPPFACTNGNCVCTPNCDGKTCGNNGCGGSCGSCISPATCTTGQCIDHGCLGSTAPKTCLGGCKSYYPQWDAYCWCMTRAEKIAGHHNATKARGITVRCTDTNSWLYHHVVGPFCSQLCSDTP